MGRTSMWAGGIIAIIFLQCVTLHRGKVYIMGLGSPIISLLTQLMKHGYYGPYCIYRKDEGRFVSDAIDPDLCTHVIYAFANVENGEIAPKEWNDATTYDNIQNLKSRNHNLKTLLSLGGYVFNKTIWKTITRSPDSRSKFVMSVIKLLREKGFDGFDLAWHTSDYKDKRQMAKLVQDLSVAFRHEAPAEKKLLLSVAVPAGREFIDRGYDIPTISQHADFLNFMTFDFHGSWESHTGHVSPLFNGRSNAGATPDYNVDTAVKFLISKGAPAEKIIMGIPTYGRTFTLSSTQTFVGASASGAGTPGHFTNEEGALAHYEICDFNSLAHVEWIEEQKVPYSYKGNQWVGYEDKRSVKEKVQYMKNSHLGGIMIWSLDQDDFSGSFCKEHQKYPLVGTVKEELNKKE